MEKQRLAIRLPGGRQIVWHFLGPLPGERLAAIRRLVRSNSIDETLPADIEIFVSLAECMPADQRGWTPQQTIRAGRGLSARLISENQIEILLHEADLDEFNLMVSQLRRLVWYGFLPLVLRREALLLHGALIARNGDGVILGGPSGSGKTTCASRVPPPWQALADDAVLVVRQGNDYFAQGLPTWSRLYGEEKLEPIDWNTTVRLKGIFQIIQASKDHLTPVDFQERVHIIMSQYFDFRSMWGIRYKNLLRRPLAEAAADFAIAAASKIPMGRLYCSLTGEFWNEVDHYPGKN